MTDRPPIESDSIDPVDRTPPGRVEARTDQAVAPDDPAAVVRVTTAGVHGRPSARVPGSRGPLLAMALLVTAVVVAGLALRTAPVQTDQTSPSLDGSVAAGASSDGAVTVPTGAAETPTESFDSTAVPTPEATPSAAATASPTKKPQKTPRPDPGPTDSDHTDWTPPPGFVGSITISDYCSHANGTEEVRVEADYNSPVVVTQVEMSLDGEFFGRGGGPVGEELIGTVIIGRPFDVGRTLVIKARFVTGLYNVDLIARRESEPFLVPQGSPCPGG